MEQGNEFWLQLFCSQWVKVSPRKPWSVSIMESALLHDTAAAGTWGYIDTAQLVIWPKSEFNIQTVGLLSKENRKDIERENV